MKNLKTTRIRIYDTVKNQTYHHLAGMELKALFSSLNDEAYVTDPSTKDPVVIFPGDYMEVNTKETVKPPCTCAMCTAKINLSEALDKVAERMSLNFATEGKRLILVANPNPTNWVKEFLEQNGWDLPKEGAKIIEPWCASFLSETYKVDPRILDELKKWGWNPAKKRADEVMDKVVEMSSKNLFSPEKITTGFINEKGDLEKPIKFSVFESWYNQKSEEVKKVVSKIDEIIKEGGSFKGMRNQIINNFLEETHSKLKNLLEDAK